MLKVHYLRVNQVFRISRAALLLIFSQNKEGMHGWTYFGIKPYINSTTCCLLLSYVRGIQHEGQYKFSILGLS
jgi:hypothetical protein